MKKIRFAVVGCGRIAKNHLGAIADSSRAVLAAVCDLVPERAEGYAQRFGVPAYLNYHEMLQQVEIDVVCLLTPSGAHYSHALDMIRQYRKHVVIEKPMVLAMSHMEDLFRTAREHDVRVFPVYQNRYNRAIQRVRRDLVEGRLGRLVLGAVRLRWCRPQPYYDRDPWRGTWAMDGGALTNQGIHYLDLLQYLAGDVETVYCRTATRLVDVEVEDTGVATLAFPGGALGVVEITTAARPRDYEASVSLLCEQGTAVLGGIACNQLLEYSLDPQALADSSEEFPDAYGYGHWPFFEDVVAELLDGRPHPLSPAEGARAIRLLNALYQSAEDGKAVEVATTSGSRRLGQPDPELERLYRADQVQ